MHTVNLWVLSLLKLWWEASTYIRKFGMLLLERNYPAEEMLVLNSHDPYAVAMVRASTTAMCQEGFHPFVLSFFDSGPRGSGSLLDSPFSLLSWINYTETSPKYSDHVPCVETTPLILKKSRVKYSRIGVEPWKPRILNPAEISLHTVYQFVYKSAGIL